MAFVNVGATGNVKLLTRQLVHSTWLSFDVLLRLFVESLLDHRLIKKRLQVTTVAPERELSGKVSDMQDELLRFQAVVIAI